jgi:hypothetical protein
MERYIQTASSLAFLALCIVGTALGVKALTRPTPPAASASVPPGAIRPAIPLHKAGDPIQVAGVDFSKADRTLLLVLQKGCIYCETSMPFYQQLTTDPTIVAGTHMVAVAPDDEQTSIDELAKFGVRVAQVVKSPLRAMKVRGTPTAIVVNRDGVTERVMPGRLDEQQQEALVSLLKSGL